VLQNDVIRYIMPPATLGELLALQLEFEQSTSKGGNRGFTCAHCDTHFIGSQTRQLAHLIGTKGKGIAICKKIPAEDRAALQVACGGIQNRPGKGPSSGSRPASETRMYRSLSARLISVGNAGDNIHGNAWCRRRLC